MCETYRQRNILASVKKMRFLFNFSFLLLAPVVLSEKFRFDNYTLFKVLPENERQIDILQNLQDNDLRFDFWSSPGIKAEFVNIMSKPENKIDLDNFLKSNGINYEIVMSNIQE